jgi:hypothetical protein
LKRREDLRRIGITHREFDLDGGSCLRFLERKGKINEFIFGVEKLQVVRNWEEIEKVVFVDVSPEGELPSTKVEVYDHHQLREKITAFDILVEREGGEGFDPQKLREWQRLVWDSDYGECRDTMDVHHFFAKVHYLIRDEHRVYTEWFIPLFDSFFEREENINQGKKVLKETILKFIEENPNSPVVGFIQKENWLRRLEKSEEDLRKETYFFRNMLRFISHMKPVVAEKWILLTLKALDKDQRAFWDELGLIKKSGIGMCGKTLIVSQVTDGRKFKEAAAYYVHHPDEFEVPPLVKERIPDRGKVWITIKVSPQEKHFQIFPEGENEKVAHAICNEIVKAIRAEILIRRGKMVPGWEELSSEGKLEGTEPLFFNKKTHPQILWGSLKHKEGPPATIFGKTAYEILESLEDIIMYAVDEDYFPYECDPGNCRICPIYPWQLRKCARKRSQFRESLSLYTRGKQDEPGIL